MSDASKKKSGCLGKALAVGLVGLIALVIGGVFALPPIASAIAPGQIQAAINPTIKGSVEVDRVELSLFSGQQAGPIRVLDPSGTTLATVDASVDASLWSLITGSMNLGEIRINGSADITRATDGTIDLLEAIAPTNPASANERSGSAAANAPPSEPASLPAGLAAIISIDQIQATYTDAALADATGNEISTVAVRELAGQIELAVGQPIDGQLSGTMHSGAASGGLVEDGPITIAIDLRDWSEPNGALTLDGAEGSLVLSAQARDAQLEANLSAADGALTTSGPSSLTVKLGAWAERLPAVQEALASTPGLEIDAVGDLVARVESLRLPLPADGSVDLRSLAAQAEVTIGSLSGSADPAALGLSGGQRGAFSTEPIGARLSLAGDNTATLIASGSAEFAGESAGELSADFAFDGLFDEAGAAGVPGSINGQASLTGVATAILDPFVAALLQSEGRPLVRLSEDIGPRLDMTLNASQQDSGPAGLQASLTAEKVRGSASVTLDGSMLTGSEALSLTFREPSPLLRRVIPEVRVSHADPITVKVADLSLDLDRLGGAEQDLRSASGIVTLDAGTITGSVLNAQGAAKAFGAGPIAGTLDATSLGDGRVSIRLEGGGAYDGAPAGTISVVGDASGLLDETGAPLIGGMPQVELDASITELNSALLAAFMPVGEMGLDPVRDIGPIINASVKATNPSAEELHADLVVESTHMVVRGPLSLTKERVAARSTISFEQTSPVALLNAVTGIEPPLSPISTRPAQVRGAIDALNVPLGEGMAPRLQDARVEARVFVENVASAGIAVSRLATDAELRPGEGLNATGELVAARSGKPFRGDLALSADRVFDEAGAVLAPMDMGVAGSLSLNDAPPALARFIPVAEPEDGSEPLDIAAAFAQLTGGNFTLDAEFDAKSSERRASASFASPNSQLSLRAALDDQVLKTEAITAESSITNALLTVLTRPAEGAAAITLTEPARLTLSVEPMAIPLTESFAPDAARMSGTLNASGTIVASVDGESAGVGPGDVRLNDGRFSANGPLSALLGGPSGVIDVRASGSIAAPNNGSGRFSLDARPTLENAAPAGPFSINAQLADVPVAFIDALAGEPGLVLGAVGPTLSLDLAASVDTAAQAPIDSITLGMDSQRIKTVRPLTIAASGNTLSLTAPASVNVNIDPAWANTYMLGEDSDPSTPPPLLTLSAPVSATLSIDRLVLPSSVGSEGAAGPLKLGTFLIDASLDLPQAQLAIGEAKSPLGIRGGTLALKPTSVQNATLDYDLRVQQWDVQGRQNPANQPSRIWGTLFGLASSTGAIQPETARLTGSFELPSVPAGVVDAFGQTDLPSKVLGSTINAKGWYRDLSSVAGAFQLEASSPNANAKLDGSIQDGFILLPKPADGSPVATISRITPELTADLIQAIPLVQTVEKTDADVPATLVLDTGVSIPIDGNMENLSGYWSLNMGTGRFVVGGPFADLISLRDAGREQVAGKRLETFRAVMDRGVIAYHPYPLPLGEFEMLTVGVINLSNRGWENKDADLKAGPGGNIDVITYVPGGALAAEAVGGVQLPFAIGPQTMVPFRTKGPLGATKTSLDGDHLIKKNLSPENLIEGVGDIIREPAGGLLKELLGGDG